MNPQVEDKPKGADPLLDDHSALLDEDGWLPKPERVQNQQSVRVQPNIAKNLIPDRISQLAQANRQVEEEKEPAQRERLEPQHMTFILGRDIEEIASFAQQILHSKIGRLLKDSNLNEMSSFQLDVLLPALEHTLCGVGCYALENDSEMRAPIQKQLKYSMAHSLTYADLVTDLLLEFNSKKLEVNVDSWKRLCLLINPRNQRVYHKLAAAFTVSDQNFEYLDSTFACGQLHYGKLLKSANGYQHLQGSMTNQVLRYVLSAIKQSTVSVRFNPLMQQWDLSMLALCHGIPVGNNRMNLLMPFLVFTIDIPEIFIASVSSMIRTYLHYSMSEDFFHSSTFDYELLKMDLPDIITDREWPPNP